MTRLIERIGPSATGMIRLDHTHVLATFHRFRPDTPARIKRGLVSSVCLALEVHAQLEEEIFYPAMREVGPNEFLDKAVPEHDEMRRLITRLRALQPGDAGYDDTFMALMRDVIHHVAEEETTFLPQAERVLRGRLGELGAQMTRRRLQLLAPRTPELATSVAQAMPVASMMMLAGAVVGGLVVGSRLSGGWRRA